MSSVAGSPDAVSELQPQQRGAPIAVAGIQLVCLREGRLELWNLATRALVASVPNTDRGIAVGVVADAIVAVSGDPAMKQPRLARFADFHDESVAADAPYYFAGADRLVGAGARELWVSEPPRGLVRYRIASRIERIGVLEWKMNQSLTFSAAAENGMALYYESGSIVRLGASDRREYFAVTAELANPLHLVGGPGLDSAWATTQESLLLVKLVKPEARVVRRVKLGGVYHLARAGELAAVLTVEMQAGVWRRVTLAAIDASGATRWRRVFQVPRQEEAWIAASPDHVALLLGSELHAFRAHDGALVLSAAQ